MFISLFPPFTVHQEYNGTHPVCMYSVQKRTGSRMTTNNIFLSHAQLDQKTAVQQRQLITLHLSPLNLFLAMHYFNTCIKHCYSVSIVRIVLGSTNSGSRSSPVVPNSNFNFLPPLYCTLVYVPRHSQIEFKQRSQQSIIEESPLLELSSI